MNKHDELTDFSSQSILCAMDRFVKAVNNMNETVMVPCRLLDLDVNTHKSKSKVPPPLLRGGEPYSYYNVLNSVKNDLIWGPTANDDDDEEEDLTTGSGTSTLHRSSTTSSHLSTASANSSSAKGHLRRQSTLSMISVNSGTSAASDTESEECCEGSEGGDSGLEVEVDDYPNSEAVTRKLRTHLTGLYSCLGQLTDTAKYITECYQDELNA